MLIKAQGRWVLIAALAVILGGCSGGTPSGEEEGIQVGAVTFARGLTEEKLPVEPGSDFHADDTVYLSVALEGRPKAGVMAAKFYFLDDLIAEASTDLADLNSGVIFSFGQKTNVGFTLSHEEPFPAGEGYRAELFYGDEPLGTYPFRILPPPGAIPSRLASVTLARGHDEEFNPLEPAESFASEETVYLVGRGDLGFGTWLQAEWYVAGKLDGEGTRSLTMEENAQGSGFAFSFCPAGGWPAGKHEVALTMDGREVGRYAFGIEE